MKTDELMHKILQNAYTKVDIQRRVRLLREYLERGFYTPDHRPDVTKFLLEKRATTDDIEAFISWGKDFFNHFTRNNTYDLLNAIIDSIRILPVVSVYIPYEPVPAEVVKLGGWFRRNVNDTVLIDLHTDPALLGGCAFAWKGMYRDYSLRYYMQKRRDEIEKIITEYVAKVYQD